MSDNWFYWFTSNWFSLQGQGSGGISIDAGTGNATVKGSTVQLQCGAATVLSLNNATGTTFDTGGGGINIIGAAGRTIQASSANLTVQSGQVGNILTLKSDPDQAVVLEGNSLTLNGTSMTAPSAGGSSGSYLQVMINGVNYKIALLDV